MINSKFVSIRLVVLARERLNGEKSRVQMLAICNQNHRHAALNLRVRTNTADAKPEELLKSLRKDHDV